jgi:hypothetical protein
MLVVAIASIALVSLARAVSPEFHVAEAPATLTGSHIEGSEVFFAAGTLKMKCTGSSSSGTQSTTSTTSMRLAPSYSGCTFLGLAATVNMNGCEEVLQLEAGSSPPKGTIEISCPAGKEPEIAVQGGCNFKWEKPQKPGQPGFTQEDTSGPPKDIDLKMSVSGLPYVVKGCAPAIADGTYQNGQKVDSQTIKADNGGGKQEDLTVE